MKSIKSIQSSLLSVFIFLVSAAFAMTQVAFAQTDKPLDKESWIGTLNVGVELRLRLDIEKGEDGKYSGKMISLDQGNAELPCDKVTRKPNKLGFKIKLSGGIEFDADVTDGKAKGDFKQAGRKFPLMMERADGAIVESKHIQTWTGKLNAGGKEFDFQFRIFDLDGEKSAKLDSFDEGLLGIACAIERTDSKITIKVPIGANPATYIGTLNEAGDKIEGTWNQAGGKFPLSLARIELTSTRDPKLNRPQTPRSPFSFDSVELKIENKKANVVLAGSLTTPKSKTGPFPTVVMISGSGPQDRDETLFSHKPFLVVAEHLAKKGFAVFRFDDRGTAESTGDFGSATSADFATDVSAIVESLKSNEKVDKSKIILCGHSEGGIIGPMVASQRDDIAGVIMMAGPGVNGRKISFNQSRLMGLAAGASEKDMDLNDAVLKAIFEQADSGGKFDDAFKNNLVAKIVKLAADKKPGEVEGMKDQLIAGIEQGIGSTQTKWFRFFATYEPAPALEKTKCPVLAMVGEKDLQVDPKLNNPEIEAALKKGGNNDYEVKVLPSLNHLFQKCKTGALAEYNQIEHTIDESALNLISDWLTKRFK